MQEIPKNLKKLLFGAGAKWHAVVSIILDVLGLGCFVLGVVSDAIGKTLGLEPINWLIMSVALWVWGIWAWIAAYHAAKEG